MKKDALYLSAITFVLVGCASTSEVSPIGPDTYTVASSMSGNFPSWSEVKALAIKQANTFCENKNRQMTIVDWVTHGARGWTPLNAELKFKCLALNEKDSDPSIYKIHTPTEKSLTNNTLPLPAAKNADSMNDAIKSLEQLKELRDRGVITPEEFDAKKKEILNRM
ncbi:MAG: SHOCT domain-containing protein [Burkholderiaceae bacterium]